MAQPLLAPLGASPAMTLSPASPLFALQTLLNSQTPQLQHLHQLLELPAEHLAVDLGRLHDAFRREFEDLMRQRANEVASWEQRIDIVRHECTSIARALGKTVDLEQNSKGDEALPRRYQLLERVRDVQLLPTYNNRLAEIEGLNTRLAHLQQILGSPPDLVPHYQTPLPPGPRVIRSASNFSAPIGEPPASTPSSASARYGNGIGLGLPRSVSGEKSMVVDEGGSSAEERKFEDVTEKRIIELQNLIQRGEEDVAANLLNLRQLLQLTHDYVDLLVLPVPIPFPLKSTLPSTTTTTEPASPSPLRPDVPSELDAYGYQLVEHYISWAVDKTEEEVRDEMGDGGLEGVEASEDLIDWVTKLNQTLGALQAAREAEIQRVYDKLELLWSVMNVSTDDIERFVEENQGISEQSVQVYRQELDKMMLLKSDFIEEFILKKREDIAACQDQLLMGEEEREAFPSFWDSNYTDELLEAHETELDRLQAELASKRELLKLVGQWVDITGEEKELQVIMQDPSRLTGRRPPGAMLAEEKMRKRVTILKPKIEAKLLHALPAWEKDHQRPFCINGERIIETIQATLDAKLAAKDLKQRARTGASATPSVRGRTASVASSSSQSATGSTVKRKVPPTPSNAAPSSSKARLVRATPSTAQSSRTVVGRQPAGGGIACSLPRPGSVARSTTSSISLRSVSGASSITTTSSGVLGNLNRPDGNWCPQAGNVFESTTRAYGPPTANPPTPSAVRTPLPPRAKRRESFKPRPSVSGLPPPLELSKYGGWSSPVHELIEE